MFRSKSSVGVDIGTMSVKVVQLKRSGNTIELDRMGTAPIYHAGEAPSDAAERRRAQVQAVKKALLQAGISTKTSVSAVSGESIIVRYLQLPEMPENELKKALQWEAEEYIPFRLDEVNIDSMVLGKSEYENARVDVLLVSAKKDLVNDHLSVIHEAGLTPKIVDVDSFAFLNCYEANYGSDVDECVALINIGAEITSISICHKGISRFSRDIPVGGETMTHAIASQLRIAHDEAEAMKIAHGAGPLTADATSTSTQNFSSGLMDTIRDSVEGLDGGSDDEKPPEEVISRAVGAVVNDMISEVRRSIEFFENQMRDVAVQRVILGGGASILDNLREHFEADLNLPVEIIDPLRRIQPAGRDLDSAAIDSVRHGLAVGIGLGLRGLAA